jgi:transcriptional regulator with XRE-family HTH domain
MSDFLNSDKFATMIRSKRAEKGLRETAQEIGGVSASTLSRIEQGHLPDLDTYMKICDWLEVSPEFFSDMNKSVTTAEKQIVAHLRADKILDRATAESLIKMIKIA